MMPIILIKGKTDRQKESFIHHSRSNKNEFNKKKKQPTLSSSSIYETSRLGALTFKQQLSVLFFDLLTFPPAMDSELSLRNWRGWRRCRRHRRGDKKLQRPDKGSSSAIIVLGLKGSEINNQTRVKLIRLDFFRRGECMVVTVRSLFCEALFKNCQDTVKEWNQRRLFLHFPGSF